MRLRCLGLVSAGHDLRSKLQAAASHSILDIELFYEDLQALASLLPDGPNPSNLLTAVHNIRNRTNSLSLNTIVFQPFLRHEGLFSRKAHAGAIDKAKLWLQLAKILGTDLIPVSSNSLPESGYTSDLSTIVQDMAELADLGANESPPVRFAYEDLARGTHISTWERVHAVVSAVNRWNFGYGFETLNIARLVFGDPNPRTGKRRTQRWPWRRV